MAAKLTIDGYAEGAEFTQSIARDGVTFCVSVSKVGGGTVGRAYDGDWEITATTTRGQAVYDGHRLRVPVAKTHAQIAYMVVDFATDNDF